MHVPARQPHAPNSRRERPCWSSRKAGRCMAIADPMPGFRDCAVLGVRGTHRLCERWIRRFGFAAGRDNIPERRGVRCAQAAFDASRCAAHWDQNHGRASPQPWQSRSGRCVDFYAVMNDRPRYHQDQPITGIGRIEDVTPGPIRERRLIGARYSGWLTRAVQRPGPTPTTARKTARGSAFPSRQASQAHSR